MKHVQFTFTPPDYGWIDLQISGCGDDIAIYCSEVSDPFADLFDWLEQIATGAENAAWHVEEEGPSARLIFLAGSRFLGDEQTSGDVVYHLHGRKLDEHVWNDDTYWTALVQAEWQRNKALPPTVVTVSYGPTWLLTLKGKQEDSGLLDDFMARLPQIEGKIGSPRRRILLGESMGGLNVLIAGLTHHESFAKVASLCPGVYSISPFASLSEMRATLQRTGADPKIGFGVWVLARRYVADDAEWRRISPIELIGQAKATYPALYLSNGLYDAYGNFEGTQRLTTIAAGKGIPVEWHPLYGGHCAIDTVSLARFLVTDLPPPVPLS